MGFDLFVNLLASLIWFLLGWLGLKSFQYFQIIQPAKRLWHISDPRNLIICAATSTKTDTGDYFRPATGIGQLRALGYAVESLGKAYDVRVQNILLSDDQVQKQIEKDLILLGGPKNNLITRLFLEKFSSEEALVDQEGSTIFWNVNGAALELKGESVNKSVKKDYGIVIRVPNPFTSGRKTKTSLCLFSGCHTYGTIAAAKYFTQEYIRELKGMRKPHENVILLVECDVIDGFVVGVKLKDRYEF